MVQHKRVIGDRSGENSGRRGSGLEAKVRRMVAGVAGDVGAQCGCVRCADASAAAPAAVVGRKDDGLGVVVAAAAAAATVTVVAVVVAAADVRQLAELLLLLVVVVLLLLVVLLLSNGGFLRTADCGTVVVALDGIGGQH